MGKIIGISGKINSGKDLVGSLIQQESMYIWDIKKFADTLKDIVCVLLKCTREQLEDREFKETPLGEEWTTVRTIPSEYFTTLDNSIREPLTPRKILQLMGTECGRNIIHKDIWVNSLFRDYKDGYWIITDVRFLNEAKAIKNRGGILIRINRDVGQDTHISETILDDYTGFDYVINNNGTKHDLRKEVMKCLINEDLM
jgi:hypothetical protein